MSYSDREMIAYAIIALAILIAVPALTMAARRRQREKLRRRGIKTNGH